MESQRVRHDWVTCILCGVKWSVVAQSCPTLCNPMDCSLPRSSVHGIFQARILEWVAISFSRGSSWPRDRTWVYLHCRQTLYHLSHQGNPYFMLLLLFMLPVYSWEKEWKRTWQNAWQLVNSAAGYMEVEVKWLSHVWLFATTWTVAYQAPPSMGFSRQEYWSGLPFPPPGDLPNPGIEPRSPAL